MTSSRSLTSLLLVLVVALLGVVLQAEAAALRALAEPSGSHAEAASGEAKSPAHEAKVESPSTTSYTGPLIAGILAIVLIGAVIKFRARLSAN